MDKQALGFQISAVTLFHFSVSSGNNRQRKIFVTKLHIRFGHIKENGNNVRMKHYIHKLACTSWHECCLRNDRMFSERGKQIRKQYKITSSQMFFLIMLSQLLHFFFTLDAM